MKKKFFQVDAHFCFYAFSGKDSCSGDSGGPLMSQKDGDFKRPKYLVGIVSFGTRRCGKVIYRVREQKSYILNFRDISGRVPKKYEMSKKSVKL